VNQPGCAEVARALFVLLFIPLLAAVKINYGFEDAIEIRLRSKAAMPIPKKKKAVVVITPRPPQFVIQ
jgi:hypothetical protein